MGRTFLHVIVEAPTAFKGIVPDSAVADVCISK